LVDDDADFAASLETWLSGNGYTVLMAAGGAAGLEKAVAEKPDLMILDVMMATETEGIEISRKLAAMPELKSMPVLLLTGVRRAKSLPFGLEPDANWLPVRSVLEKPVQLDELLAEIHRILP
jgi:CheY-like chemotaxis protein